MWGFGCSYCVVFCFQFAINGHNAFIIRQDAYVLFAEEGQDCTSDLGAIELLDLNCPR